MNKDPVCNMTINPRESNHTVDYYCQKYYFCSEGCMKAFNTNPKQYLNRNTAKKSGHVHVIMGGCCGMGMSSGWMRYLYIGIMVTYLILLFLR